MISLRYVNSWIKPMIKQLFHNPNKYGTSDTYYAHRSKKNPTLFFVGRTPSGKKVMTSKYLSDVNDEGALYIANKPFDKSEPEVAAEAFDAMGFVPERTFEVVKIEVINGYVTRIRLATAELKAYEKNNNLDRYDQ